MQRILSLHPGRALLAAWLTWIALLSAIAASYAKKEPVAPNPAVAIANLEPEIQPIQKPEKPDDKPASVKKIDPPIVIIEPPEATQPKVPKVVKYSNKELEKAVLGKEMSEVISIIGADYELIVYPKDRPRNMFENPVHVTLMYRGRNSENSVAFIRFTQQIAMKVDFVN